MEYLCLYDIPSSLLNGISISVSMMLLIASITTHCPSISASIHVLINALGSLLSPETPITPISGLTSTSTDLNKLPIKI